VLALLVGMAGVKRLAYSFHHFVVELQPAEKVRILHPRIVALGIVRDDAKQLFGKL
jgi:hypothetical protein